jgi:serine/threonine-protein kinase
MALLEDGCKIRDTYEVERFLGEGAFAEVYRVRHRFLGRQAMKVFKTAGMALAEINDMLGEAALLSRIGHPNIVRVFDANVLTVPSGTYGYFTMEYVAGGSLDRYWRSYQDKFMPVEEAVAIVQQTCEGMAVAHSENPPVIHRDLKPQNILIGYDGLGMRVRVSDFGLAKRVNPLTLLASARGTLGFKPPESFENMDSSAADVWALGTTLHLLLTDMLPFPALDDRDLTDSRRFLRPLRPPSLYNIQVDPALDAIVARCLAANPRDRYPSAVDLLDDLRRWVPGHTGKAPQTSGSTSKSRKNALGMPRPTDRQAAEADVRKAMTCAKEPGTLMVAADTLEEVVNRHPDLRERYEWLLKLWRRGISG